MKVTIIQLDASRLDVDWERLRQHTADHASELVLLPEMCFASWFCTVPERDDLTWLNAVRSHEMWLERLPELGAGFVIGTAPRNVGAKGHNVAYLWTARDGLRWFHSKTYLPNDEGYWEANWYDRAPIDFQPTFAADLAVGVVICTEIWFLQHAREYGKRGIHLLLNPRSTPRPTNAKWLAGGRTAAVVSGAYCLSSNHAGQIDGVELGGAGWLCDPYGVVLATTCEAEPFVTLDVDLEAAERAKSTYPRDVDDSQL